MSNQRHKHEHGGARYAAARAMGEYREGRRAIGTRRKKRAIKNTQIE